MENPLKNLSQKDLLYIAGAIASLAGIAFLFHKGTITLPAQSVPGAVTDMPASAGSDAGGFSPGYTNYNYGPLYPESLDVGSSPGEKSAGDGGCCCPSAYGCAGASALDTGTASTDLNSFLDYMKSINPNYQALVSTQLRSYNEYFQLGSSYGNGRIAPLFTNG